MRLHRRVATASLAVVVIGAGAAVASSPTQTVAKTPRVVAVPHHPLFLPVRANQWSRFGTKHGPVDLTPPAPPCPLPDNLPRVTLPVLGEQRVGPCINVPQTVAVGQPFIGNMAYWGGHVQVHPHLYLVFLGWGRPGAFKSDCGAPAKLNEGKIHAVLKCDPDGAGKLMADFASQLGGTQWAGVQSQYYQSTQGKKEYISNDRNQLAGIWVDDVNKTNAKITYRMMAQEAERAAIHFKVKPSQLINSNFIIAQPQNFSDPVAQASGYCAFHDIIEPDADPHYAGLRPGLPYTNMPYVLNQGTSCGQGSVNVGAAGKLDAVTLALGHEIEETATDPGAEDHIQGQALGGWYDPFDGNENGDKCAYVSNNPVGIGPNIPEPGAAGNIVGNRGDKFAVQSLWSNQSAAGVGYCAGAGSDLPF